jgi:hypothetical protein
LHLRQALIAQTHTPCFVCLATHVKRGIFKRDNCIVLVCDECRERLTADELQDLAVPLH